jgi:late competence protein required for DNA uptake (superfamily II DNA/RNA helicase)
MDQVIKMIEDARKQDPNVDILDPRFDVCPDMPTEVRKAKFERGDEDLLLDDDAND